MSRKKMTPERVREIESLIREGLDSINDTDQREAFELVCQLLSNHAEALTQFPFTPGDRVVKSSGDYTLSGEVRAAFLTKAGKVRFVVDHSPAAPGLLHIYGPANIEHEQ